MKTLEELKKERKEFDSWESKLPCGQQNCWVYCHVKDM